MSLRAIPARVVRCPFGPRETVAEVRGYTQNFIFDRAHGRGRPASYKELPIDGIVELWFTRHRKPQRRDSDRMPARR